MLFYTQANYKLSSLFQLSICAISFRLPRLFFPSQSLLQFDQTCLLSKNKRFFSLHPSQCCFNAFYIFPFYSYVKFFFLQKQRSASVVEQQRFFSPKSFRGRSTFMLNLFSSFEIVVVLLILVHSLQFCKKKWQQNLVVIDFARLVPIVVFRLISFSTIKCQFEGGVEPFFSGNSFHI